MINKYNNISNQSKHVRRPETLYFNDHTIIWFNSFIQWSKPMSKLKTNTYAL